MSRSRIDSKMYDDKYFDESGGSFDFKKRQLSPWVKEAVSLVQINSDKTILDIGCGRGEVISHCSQLGAKTIGVDYSTVALKISSLAQQPVQDNNKKFVLIQANALDLPFIEAGFDIIFMMDIVEHLYPEELFKVLTNVKRILNDGGTLIIHTMPNANYLRYGYPIFRNILRLIGKKLPKDSRKRVYHGEVHVNEQTPKKLKKTLMACGYSSVKMQLTQIHGSWLQRLSGKIILLKHILANDIFAVAKK